MEIDLKYIKLIFGDAFWIKFDGIMRTVHIVIEVKMSIIFIAMLMKWNYQLRLKH
jgi:hypothetical protein